MHFVDTSNIKKSCPTIVNKLLFFVEMYSGTTSIPQQNLFIRNQQPSPLLHKAIVIRCATIRKGKHPMLD